MSRSSLRFVFFDAFPFTRGYFTVDDNAVRIVNDAVADNVGKDRITDLFPLARDVKLRTEYCGRLFVPRLRDLEKISRFGFIERVKQPFVEDEQHRFLVLLYGPEVRSISTGYGKLGKQFRMPDVSYLKKAACRRHAESAGDIRFALAGHAKQKNVVPFRYEIVGGQLYYLRLIHYMIH